MALCHPYSTEDVAKLFIDHVFWLHGMPATIVSDRDLVLTNTFRNTLLRCKALNCAGALHIILSRMDE